MSLLCRDSGALNGVRSREKDFPMAVSSMHDGRRSAVTPSDGMVGESLIPLKAARPFVHYFAIPTPERSIPCIRPNKKALRRVIRNHCDGWHQTKFQTTGCYLHSLAKNTDAAGHRRNDHRQTWTKNVQSRVHKMHQGRVPPKWADVDSRNKSE